MYEGFIKKRNSLVFPVTCYGELLLSYESNNPDTNNNDDLTDDSKLGIWGLDSSFTIQALITPYDCNGNSTTGKSITTSMKTLPLGGTDTTLQDHLWLDTSNRLAYEMALFYSANIQLYLVNAASALTGPAEYKIKFIVKDASGTTSTLLSDAVILPLTGYNEKSEAIYLITPYHIGASFNAATGTMSITLNNVIVAEKIHDAKTTSSNLPFAMDPSDCFIGSNESLPDISDAGADTGTATATRKQFIGELHEFCITRGYSTTFNPDKTLTPNFNSTVLYLRFEEVDL
jgi:hypothetical protein